MTHTLKTVNALNKSAIASSSKNLAIVSSAILTSTAFAVIHGNVTPMNELANGLSISDAMMFKAFLRNLNPVAIETLCPEADHAGLKALGDSGAINAFTASKGKGIAINTSPAGKALFKSIRSSGFENDAGDIIPVTVENIIEMLSGIEMLTEKDAEKLESAFNADKTFKALVKKIIMTETDDVKAKHHAHAINQLITEGRFSQADIDAMFAARVTAKSEKAKDNAANDKAPLVIEHEKAA